MLSPHTDLGPLVRGFLEAEGFRLLEQESDLVVADRLVTGLEHDLRLVWTVPAGEDPGRYQSRLRASISAHRPSYPEARAYLVSRSLAGFSRDFLVRLRDESIKLLPPIYFFDTPFNSEQMPSATRTAIEEIRAEGAQALAGRVLQRYSEIGANGEKRDGVDLLETLLAGLRTAEGPKVRIVVGRAGIGKSVLFSSLFTRLYDDFLDLKKRRTSRPRPVPFVPRHLRDLPVPRMRLLVENFLRTDVALPVTQEAFRWLLGQGFVTWMFDGLDELYAGDVEFFEELTDFVTAPGSRAQVTLFCRDSLVSTSDSFQEFRELLEVSDFLTIYRLSEWDHQAKRAFAWMAMEERTPGAGEADTPPVAGFLHELKAAPTLDSLSGLPFYCELLLEEFRDGQLQRHADEVSLLDFVVDRMIRREVDKGLLALDLFDEHGLEDWLEEIAISYVEDGCYSEIDRDQAREYGQLVLREGIEPKQRDQLLLSLLQFPLFRDSPARARFAFTHDLIAEALAARGYLRILARDAVVAGHRLARTDLEEPTLLRLMSRRLDTAHWKGLVAALKGGRLQGRAFPVLLSLLMIGRPERDLLQQAELGFEGQDLSGVRFVERDLSGVSFRLADLSYSVFERCDLQGALFEGAFLRCTRFGSGNQLREAQFGDAERVESILDGKRLRAASELVRQWISDVTGCRDEPWEPCPTALQVRHLFGKYITPLGDPRRDNLRRDALVAGKRYSQAASKEDCLEQAVHHGYLVGPDHRHRFRRAAGDLYSEMVSLVRDSRTSDGLGCMIGQLCVRRGCDHLLTRTA